MLAREDENTQALLQTWADVGEKGRAGGVKAKQPDARAVEAAATQPDTAGLPGCRATSPS